MLSGLFTSAFGMKAQEMRNDTIAQNLANASTVGFRRQLTTVGSSNLRFNDAVSTIGILPDWAVPMPLPAPDPRLIQPTVSTDAAAGAVRMTGNKTDLALQGKAYFAIKLGAGEAYTRNGAFTLDQNNQLVTQDGDLVLGQKGPITIATGDWEVSRDGSVLVNGKAIERLKIMEAANDNATTRLGANLVQANMKPAGQYAVQQGALESSNVNVVSEMVSMLAVTREYEANQKCIQTQDSLLDRIANDLGRA